MIEDEISNFKDMILEKRNILNVLNNILSPHIYICGHTNPRRNVIVSIQISAFFRAERGDIEVERICLRIAMLFRSANFSDAESAHIRAYQDNDR
jgi:hypothetical protein